MIAMLLAIIWRGCSNMHSSFFAPSDRCIVDAKHFIRFMCFVIFLVSMPFKIYPAQVWTAPDRTAAA